MIFDKENISKTLKDLPEIIETYFKNIHEDVVDKKRNATTWTIRQHLYHIVDVQEMLYNRMLKIKNEENPIITPFFPENESEKEPLYNSIQKAFSYYKEIRSKQLLLINELREAELSKEAKHDEYLKYNIPIIINHMIFHEYWHMSRIEEIWNTRDEFFS
jgi:uncharacterized damage-inducible protein DinB